MISLGNWDLHNNEPNIYSFSSSVGFNSAQRNDDWDGLLTNKLVMRYSNEEPQLIETCKAGHIYYPYYTGCLMKSQMLHTSEERD